jgi:2-amino-4-hydroxy-6-hydroxymethyldihydropteridine diphosphokinase
LNQVLEVETIVSSQVLLQTILTIEQEMGRNRKQKWEARIIDIDILFYGAEIINTKNLVVPHPLLHQRRFTLLPLTEIAPNMEHPVLHQTISQLLQICPDQGLVEKM